ncbi:MAG: hypothetical protein KF704_09540 [Crocinitomicaceae bacterium]|nr:hypothetical protein [Crocinitomicaceae bacterium]
MAKKLEIIHGLIWLAFLVYMFNLFVPDYKHTYYYIDANGVYQYTYGTQDFHLKFILLVTTAIPLLIMTFVKHTQFSRFASLVFPVLMCTFIYLNGFATSEDSYFFYERNDFAGYTPYAGYYIGCSCALLFLVTAILKSTVPVTKKYSVSKEIIDDFK